MTTTQTLCGTPDFWTEIISSRSFVLWNAVKDSALPIPHEFIAVRAYHLYVMRGRAEGNDIGDWLQAEAEQRSLFRQYVAADSRRDWGDSDGGNSKTGDAPCTPPIGDKDGVNCGGSRQRGRMVSMKNKRKIEELSPDDPMAQEAADELGSYQDHVGHLTPAQRQEFRDKVLAILCETGEIIAAADDTKSLRVAVARAGYGGREWRLVDGPTGKAPLPLTEFETDTTPR